MSRAVNVSDTRFRSDAEGHLLVRQRFPIFVFMVRTSLSREAASEVLTKAFNEPWQAKWVMRVIHRVMKQEEPQLSGRIQDGSFSCQVRTSPVPSISGEIISRSHGGADLMVRVNCWVVYLWWSVVLAVGVILTLTKAAPITTKLLEIAGTVVFVAFVTWLGCSRVINLVLRIFGRIFSVQSLHGESEV